MINTKMVKFDFMEAVKWSFMIDYEYVPGLVVKMMPTNLSRKDFYPQRSSAETIKIILEDGERMMDRLLFKKLYKFSKNPASGIFADSEDVRLPFVGKEFDDFLEFLTNKHCWSEFAAWDYTQRFLSYFKITHFLMPETNLLYAVDSIPQNFLDHLDIALELFPPLVIDEIVFKCDLRKYVNHPEVVKTIHRRPTGRPGFSNLGCDVVDYILPQIKPTSEALGLDHEGLCRLMDDVFC